ncbi:MAG: hypothetical protein ABSF70_03470 [Terracidiphilus sp.]|jgi:hypothetical protein
MRKFLVVLSLLLSALVPTYGQKTRFGETPTKAKPGVDYPIKVHISGMHLGQFCSTGSEGVGCGDAVYVDAVIDGKKIELRGSWPLDSVPYQWDKDRIKHFYLLPGDFQARLLKDANSLDGTPIYWNYEFVLPDRTIWRCTVTGISE